MIGDLVDKRLESVPRNFLRDREWHTEVLQGEVCYLARQKQFGSLDVFQCATYGRSLALG
jgi:hypothetical protein